MLALGLQILGFHSLRHDDAYISFRYGQNLASGNGLVFNPGERFLGATSPGHMLLSAVAYRGWGKESTPSIMSVLGCVGWTAQAVALWFLLRTTLGPLGAGMVSAVVALGGARSGQWVALETNLAVGATLGSLALAARGRAGGAAVLGGIGVLLRPDAALAVAAIAILLAARDGVRAAVRFAVVAALLVAPWLIFATVYFGTPLPNSAAVQFQRSELLPYLVHAFSLAASTLVPVESSALAWVVAGGALLAAVLLVLRSRDFGLHGLALYGALHLTAYSFLRPQIGHDWHLYPSTLIAVVLGMVGVWGITLRLPPRLRPAMQRALCVALPLAFGLRFAADAVSQRGELWFGARDQAYRKVAGLLAARSNPEDRFASPEVGTIAYLTELRAFDLVGLVSRHDVAVDGPVRWVVLDPTFLHYAPPVEPLEVVDAGDFRAVVFEVPEKRSYVDYFRRVQSQLAARGAPQP